MKKTWPQVFFSRRNPIIQWNHCIFGFRGPKKTWGQVFFIFWVRVFSFFLGQNFVIFLVIFWSFFWTFFGHFLVIFLAILLVIFSHFFGHIFSHFVGEAFPLFSATFFHCFGHPFSFEGNDFALRTAGRGPPGFLILLVTGGPPLVARFFVVFLPIFFRAPRGAARRASLYYW